MHAKIEIKGCNFFFLSSSWERVPSSHRTPVQGGMVSLPNFLLPLNSASSTEIIAERLANILRSHAMSGASLLAGHPSPHPFALSHHTEFSIEVAATPGQLCNAQAAFTCSLTTLSGSPLTVVLKNGNLFDRMPNTFSTVRRHRDNLKAKRTVSTTDGVPCIPFTHNWRLGAPASNRFTICSEMANASSPTITAGMHSLVPSES